MDSDPREIEGVKTFWTYVRNAWRRVQATRTRSFYYILALFVALPLGTRMIQSRDDPREFAFFITLHLVLLFVVLVQAVYDMAEITRDHFREREKLFRNTLGEPEFVKRLGQRVSEHRNQS